MDFEYDEAKSLANKQKHGIDFLEAQGLWEDVRRLIVPGRVEGEPRWVILAHWRGKIWAGIFTIRQGRVRIISVRRAREDEKEKYNYE